VCSSDLLREAELARTLASPAIVRVFDAGEDDGAPFLVLELMRGETLRGWLAQVGRLPEEAARAIFHSLALALEHAHGRGVIHRDIKPENVFLTEEGVKLGDFGNARVVSLASVTGASLTWGTPEYVAPEAFMRGRADPRSDLYSLGVVLYEMLAGRLPWSRAETLARLAGGGGSKPPPPPDGASDQVVALLTDLLAFSPADRPASAEEIFARLSQPPPDPAAVVVAAKCPACGAARPNDLPRCLACGHEMPRLAHDPKGRWQLVLDELDDDPAATARLLSLLDPIVEYPGRSLQFLTGRRDLYSPEERQTGIPLPAILFSALDHDTARSLEVLFRREGLEVSAVEGRPLGRLIRGALAGISRKQVIAMSLPLAALLAMGATHDSVWPVVMTVATVAIVGVVALAATGVKWWKKRRAPSESRGVFALRHEIAAGPVAEAVLAGVTGAVGGVRAPEVRALLGDVATELYRLTRRAEQLAGRSGGASSELELLRRTAAAAPALLERLRRMAARLDDLDAALEGQTEGELMQALARLERAAAAPGADRPALAATRRELEATLERRHATEQERARLSAKLCALLGQLRVVYRQAAGIDTAADREARAIEAASAELDALLAAPAPN